MGVCLIDLREPLFSSGISVILGVVLQSEVSIGPLNFLKGCVPWNPKNFVVGALAMRVLLVEELPLSLLSESVLVVELLESSISIVGAELVDKVIVVVSTGWARQHEVGLADVIELPLGVNSVAGMLFGVPVGSQLLIGVFNLGLGGLVGEAESGVVVLLLVS